MFLSIMLPCINVTPHNFIMMIFLCVRFFLLFSFGLLVSVDSFLVEKNWISSTLIHRMITYFSQLLCCDSVDDYFDTSLASNSKTDIYSYVLYIKACLDNFLSPSLLTYSHFAWFTVSFYDVHITHFQTELKRIFSRFFFKYWHWGISK